MRDVTLSDLDRTAGLVAEDGTVSFAMDEEAFGLFYDRTARPLWAYLSRTTGEAQLADDLLQETYYRFLRARRDYDSDAHRQNALYRIATNLVRDAHRQTRRRPAPMPLDGTDHPDRRQALDVAERAGARTDINRAMARLRPRERQLLWLAYALGFSHQEIAEGLGLKTGSIKLLLWRARRRLLGFLVGGQRAQKDSVG